MIVDFKISIYEPWSEDLNNPDSQSFLHLSELYLLAFSRSLATIATSTYKFAQIRVVSFVLISEGTLLRERRDTEFHEQDKSSIEAEIETVFNVLVAKDESEVSGINAEAENTLKDNIVGAVEAKVADVVADKRVDSEDGYQPGELNFYKNAEITGIMMERDILATYTDYVLDCDCATQTRTDYKTCIPVDGRDDICPNGDVYYKPAEEYVTTSCQCASWAQWEKVDFCTCDSDDLNCKQDYNRTCLTDTTEFNIQTKNECVGDSTKLESCQAVYGQWVEWTKCSPTCVTRGELGTQTRERQCLSDSDDSCDNTQNTQARECDQQYCETCNNFIDYCSDYHNTECVDENNKATCPCRHPFGLDANGQCTKCNALRPFAWQCTGKHCFASTV